MVASTRHALLELLMPATRRAEAGDFTVTIGHQLARLRKARGISQEELAEQLSISQTNVSAYERGALRLHGDLIVKLTRILKVSADELLGLAQPPRVPVIRDRRFLRRLELIDRLPKRDKDALLRMLINASKVREL